MTVTVTEASDRRELSKFKERWDSILAQSAVRAPYFSFDWYSTALETIDRDKKPLLLFFQASGKDIGFVPLVYKKKRISSFSYFEVGFVYNPYTPYQGLVCLDGFKEVFAAMLRHLRQRFGSLFYLDLNEIRLTPEENEALIDLASSRLYTLEREDKPGSRYVILNESFEQTLDNLKSKTQKEFRRKIKRMSHLGDIGLIRVQGNEQIDRHLDRYFIFRSRTWKGQEPQSEFYYRLCKKLDKSGRLYFYALTIDERPIAYLICALGGDTIYGIKITYNPSYYAFSPGVILLYNCIENMFTIPGVREFDIGRGNEQFKREWTPLIHEHTRLVIYSNTILWRSLIFIRHNLLPAMRRRRAFDKLYSSLRSRLVGQEEVREVAAPESAERSYKHITREEYKDIAGATGLTARFAHEDDIERLAVATSASSLKDVKELLNHRQCLLILEGTAIVAYFCIQPAATREAGDSAEAPEIVINDWGVDEERASERLETECTAVMLEYLSDKGIVTRGVRLAARNLRSAGHT
jgi:CelD/BcsL family acetyltransferase involved in cellulose biosynthesis